MFGPHLTIDAYGCNKKKLRSVSFVASFLDDLPASIQMHKIMPPYVFSYSGLKPEDWGVSGIVLIAESHISTHTFVEKGYMSFDIFSCKDFDTESVIEKVIGAFEAKTYEHNFFMRGRHFPKDEGRNIELMKQQRDLITPPICFTQKK